jgi:vacuolar-type H+-ATPase subunit C/Vma6
MASALARYAYGHARVRARLAALLTRRQMETLAAYPDAATLTQELGALGWAAPEEAVLRSFEDVIRMLDDGPREVVVRYRARYEAENLAVLLRGQERGRPAAEIEPLLHPVGVLAPGPLAREILAAPSLAAAVDRLAPRPFGDALRRQVRALGAEAVERLRLELVAEREVYERVWEAVQALDPADRRSAAAVLGVQLDRVNLVRAARLRGRLSPEEVLAYTIRGGLHLGAAERAVLAHLPPEEWPPALARTPYGPALAAAETPAGREAALARLVVAAAERALVGPPFRLGVILAYLLLLEAQAADLRRLVEGRRLGRSEAWLRAGLVTRRRP